MQIKINETAVALILGSGLILLFLMVIVFVLFRLFNSKILFIKDKELRQHQFETRILQSEIEVQELERKRIAEDLHDDIGATLSALHLHISSIADGMLLNSPELQKFYAQSLSLASKAAIDVRGIAHDLLPKDFAELGMFEVLQNRIDELNTSNAIRFTFIADGDEKISDKNFSVTIYRIINELISNIIKHSQAQKALIQILVNETEVQIIAEDNGIGIRLQKIRKGIGMKNIQSRVDFLNGTYNIDSNEKGTTIIISIPFLIKN